MIECDTVDTLFAENKYRFSFQIVVFLRDLPIVVDCVFAKVVVVDSIFVKVVVICICDE